MEGTKGESLMRDLDTIRFEIYSNLTNEMSNRSSILEISAELDTLIEKYRNHNKPEK
jgi:hypothetical protein